MAREIERKFVLQGDSWRPLAKQASDIRQGYFFLDGKSSVRIRCETRGDNRRAWINVKQAVIGPERLEFEYEVPFDDAQEMLESLCEGPLIEKKRHRVQVNDLVWEIDEFFGRNEGLVVAEVELGSADQTIELPAWIDREVTLQQRFYNMSLVRYPFSEWSEEERP